MEKKYIAYYRVSTEQQGKSGLGLEVQQDIVRYFTKEGTCIAEYEEVHSGKNLNDLPQLQKAKAHAKSCGATLVLAKTDRLRNTQQALDLVDDLTPQGVLFCDMPSADKFLLTMFFALAERERLITSIRTKAALRVKKTSGVLLGNPKWGQSLTLEVQKKGAQSNRLKALNDPANKQAFALASILRKNGHTLEEIASELNKSGFKTPKGNPWLTGSIARLLKRK